MPFKKFDLALAHFQGFPLWPVRVLRIVKDSKGRENFIVFCYGDHKEIRLTEKSLVSYEDNIKEASQKTGKGAKLAFEEAKNSPEIYKQSKSYAALEISEPASSSSQLLERIVASEDEIARTQKSMMELITEKVLEKCGDKQQKSGDSLKQSCEMIISEIYASVSLEFTPKFQSILQSYKSLKAEVQGLENRVQQMESRIDDFEQEKLLDSLVFNGVKQLPGEDLKATTMNIITQKMGVTGFSQNDIQSIYRYRLNNSTAQGQRDVAPVFVKLRSSEMAKKVFKSKTKLAKSGIFVSEALTKRRRDILNTARDSFGVRNVWSDRGLILAKLPTDTIARRIRSLADCF